MNSKQFKPLILAASIAALSACNVVIEGQGTNVSPALLAGGIWEALLTTAAGLVVAIPTLAMLNWFERIVQRTAHEMENAVTQVFTGAVNAPPDDYVTSQLRATQR